MKRRLTWEQKFEEVRAIMLRTNHSVSAYEVGRALGYANGQAVTGILKWMVDTERAMCETRKHNLGEITYYRLSPAYVYHVTPHFFPEPETAE